MVLMDIKAAFDSVWHDGHVYKINQFRFPNELIKIVQNFIPYLSKSCVALINATVPWHEKIIYLSVIYDTKLIYK